MKVKIKTTGKCHTQRYMKIRKKLANKRIRQEMRQVCRGQKIEADPAKWCGDYHD